MSTILSNERNKESFEEKIKAKSLNTQRNIKYAIKNFEKFCLAKYDLSADMIIKEYNKADQDQLFDSLQAWINWNKENGISPNVIIMWFSFLKKYLKYQKVKLYTEEAKDNLDFPHSVRIEKEPLTKDQIRKILTVASFKNRLRIIAQISSGLRRGELLKLQKKHFDLTYSRIMVKVPAEITKSKKTRTVFFTKEIQVDLTKILNKLNDNDFVFGSDKVKSLNIGDAYQQAINRYLVKTDLHQTYENGIRTITTHSFRSYFITRFSRHDPNLAKYFAGQDQSKDLLVYDRLTLEEKLEKFLEIESDLLIYDDDKEDKQSKVIDALEEKIQKLTKEKAELKDKDSNNDDLYDMVLELKKRLDESQSNKK